MEYDFILASAMDAVEHERSADVWVSQALFSEALLFVIAPSHPQFGQLPEQPEEFDLSAFSDASYVTMRLDHHFIDFTYQVCQDAGFFPKSYFQTDDFLLKMNMVREGLAVALLPASCMEEANRLCPGLRSFPVKAQRSVTALRKKKRLLSEASLDFWDCLLEFYQFPRDERE